MAKFPDLSKLTEKLNIQGFVDDVKSMMNPGGDIPEEAVEQGDPIATKLAEMAAMLHNLANTNSQQAKDIIKLNRLVGDLYKEVEALQNPPQTSAVPSGNNNNKKSSSEAAQPTQTETVSKPEVKEQTEEVAGKSKSESGE